MQNSTFQIEHNRLFNELQEALKQDLAWLTGKANGGRSILFIYPPVDDDAYIAEGKKRLTDCFKFIDLHLLFSEFITNVGIETFKENYHNFHNEVFFSDNFPEETFFYAILQQIQEAFDSKLIPVLVHTGILFGMNFSNINIMEHPAVIASQIPLVVFYPATVDKDNIKFLGRQSASKYRCIVIK